jgi:hypothetical protein
MVALAVAAVELAVLVQVRVDLVGMATVAMAELVCKVQLPARQHSLQAAAVALEAELGLQDHLALAEVASEALQIFSMEQLRRLA